MAEDLTPEDDSQEPRQDGEMEDTRPVSGLYQDWFLDYASYVILDRAVPYINDGLKPVQRRILHAMKDLDDGRFNKVANIIGHTMQYHPHGDAAIGDAIVNLGQKELLIETQGNWGNILTGDGAAAPRYIEARLSKFALEVVFNPQTTEWQLSYDGRKKEPVTLPVKFPLVLAQGVEGIAVGLSTKILPHNFIELCEASIHYLKGRSFKLYPDFPTGGMVDVSDYKKGNRGGKVRVRARIEELDKSTLVIREVPYGTTTSSLIDSILKANDKGKIKIRRIDDNTAADVEIVVHLPKGISPSVAIDGLYAFTHCEVSISPNTCVIIDDHPVFSNVNDLLKLSTDKTVDLLKLELEIRKGELEHKWHMSSLEKIFIENRIYRDIEEEETWEGVIRAIDKGLEKFVATPSTQKPGDKRIVLMRDITEEDIVRLTEIKIKRISKFDSFKADEYIRGLEEELEEVKHHLANLIDFAVDYFKRLIDKFGKGRERLTEIRTFDTIDRTQVAVANAKLYMDAEGGFIGTGLKKSESEFVCECSDIDDIIVFRQDGGMVVTKVSDKTFVGKGIIYTGVWTKGDDRMVYHLAYKDNKDKRSYVKRFQVMSITRDREYDLCKGKKGGQVLYFSANPNGESEVLHVKLRKGANTRLRRTEFDLDLAEIGIKGRGAGGNLLTKYPVLRIEQKSRGASTLGGRDIWFDETVKRLNTDGIGQYLGNFEGDDKILILYEDGSYELNSQQLNNRYEGKGRIAEILKLEPDTVVSAVHYDPKNDATYVKRFLIETHTLDKKQPYISEEEGAKLLFVTGRSNPVVRIAFSSRKLDDRDVDLKNFIDIKGWKAMGNKLSGDKIRKVELLSAAPLPTPENEDDEDDKPKGKSEDKGGSKKEDFKAKDPKDIPMEIVDTRQNEEDNPTLF